MDAMERSHTLESAVVSSLFNARQMIWTELSSVISEIKGRFDCSNKERNTELNRLLSENHALSGILKRLREIIEGKELEINGLRRQLQGFYTGRPVCSTCARSIDLIKSNQTLANSDEQKNSNFVPGCPAQSHALVVGEARKRDRRNTSLLSESTEPNQTDSISDSAVIPWLGKEMKSLKRRPSQKRPCVRTSESTCVSRPTILVQDTQAYEENNTDNDSQLSDKTPTNVPRSPEGTINDSESEQSKLLRNVNEGEVGRDESSDSMIEKQLDVAKLSPPSESYNASLAIQNAVNHLDLANYENTVIDSIHSQASQTQYGYEDGSVHGPPYVRLSAQLGTMSRLLVRRNSAGRPNTNRYIKRRFALSMEPFKYHNQRHTKELIVAQKHHKPTCRHVRHSIEEQMNEPKATAVPVQKFRDLDETGADLSLPSDFLQSERSEAPYPVNDIAVQSKGGQPESSESDKVLPSLGGSPTRDEILFKRPKGPVPHALLNLQSSSQQQRTATHRYDDIDTQETQLPERPPNMCQLPSSTQVEHDTDPLVARMTSKEKPDKENLNQKDSAERFEQHDSRVVRQRSTVKYVGPVERRKSVRREMPAHTCPSCQKYFESTGLTNPEIAARIHRCSRHRTLHGPPPSTPKGFWDLDISACDDQQDSQAYDKNNANKVSLRSHSLRRRRPLRASNSRRLNTSTSNSA